VALTRRPDFAVELFANNPCHRHFQTISPGGS
jgi:hypothetical protein